MQTSLYRHFDATGRLLYVGVSLCILMRTAAHRSSSPWFVQVSKITIEHFATRDEALTAETRAIANEKPVHNIDQTPRRNRATRSVPVELKDTTYSLTEAANVIGIHSSTLRNWIERNNFAVKPIEGVWPFRWLKSNVDAFIRGQS